MTGEFNIKKFGSFLKSFWGLLASFTVILPTVIYVLNTKQIQDSILNEYYIGIPTTFALLSIPFVFLFEDKLSILPVARRFSILFASLSICMLFAFLVMKNIYVVDTYYSNPGKNGYGRIEIKEAKTGEIRISTFDSTSTEPIKIEERTNVLELISLALFSLSIIFLTSSFSGLGVFFYTKSTS